MSEPLRILVLEDSALDAELNLRELRRAGIDAQWQRVDTEADYLAALDTSPDLILADYSLPQFDGLSALKLLRERQLEIPFILVSGMIGEEAAVEAMKCGATDYVLKQRITRLGAVVRRALEEERLRAEKRHAEAALQESEERLRLALAASRTIAWSYDMRSGAIVQSDSVADIVGLRATNQGVMDWRTIHPADVAGLKACFERAIEERGTGWTEVRVAHADTGVFVWLQIRGRVNCDADGNPVQILGTAMDITVRKQAELGLQALNETLEQRVADRTAELNKRAAEVQALATELTLVEQRERDRLSQLLHDELQQLIFAARMGLESVRSQLADTVDDSIDDRIRETDELLARCGTESRNLSHELSPPSLHRSGLLGALNWLALEHHERYGMTIYLSAEAWSEPADEALVAILFRAVRELLFNIVKHARVSRADVSLTSTADGKLQIEVSDAGQGFDARQLPGVDAPGMGLSVIRDRLRLLSGSVVVSAVPGHGTRVTLNVPLQVA